ncbi:hypothetical protein ACJX0J_034623 [Zea mays]
MIGKIEDIDASTKPRTRGRWNRACVISIKLLIRAPWLGALGSLDVISAVWYEGLFSILAMPTASPIAVYLQMTPYYAGEDFSLAISQEISTSRLGVWVPIIGVMQDLE